MRILRRARPRWSWLEVVLMLTAVVVQTTGAYRAACGVWASAVVCVIVIRRRQIQRLVVELELAAAAVPPTTFELADPYSLTYEQRVVSPFWCARCGRPNYDHDPETRRCP